MGNFTFRLPDIGEGTAEAEIVAWHVKPGDPVKEDAPLVDVMTEKATVEITSPVSGIVLSLAAEIGARVPIGIDLVEFETDDAPVVSAPVESASAEAAPPPSSLAGPAATDSHLAASNADGAQHHTLAAPAVRERARNLGLSLASIAGTGEAGRVTHDDLDRVLTGGAGAAQTTAKLRREGVSEVKLVGLRRKIAERMEISTRTIPHFAYVEEVDVTALEDLRVTLNARHGDARPRLTMLPFLVRALSQVLPAFPQANATYDESTLTLRQHAALHVGIAAQTPGGLLVPVVRHAEARSLWDCAGEIRRLTDAARAGTAKPDELSGSTITITSLGALGGIAAVPVINPPEVAVIGVNRLAERAMVINGVITIRKMMNLSSSFDHRIIDGFDAASLIQRIKVLLEQPALLFVD